MSSDKKVDIILTVIGFAIGILVALLCYPYISGNGSSILILFVTFLVYIIGRFGIVQRKRNAKTRLKREHYTFSEEDNTMTLLQRSEISYNALNWEPIYEHDLKYHPSKTIYTGATSGGVTMGGFHTTEAYYQERTTKASERYIAYINLYSGDHVYIREIILSGNLVEQAKKHPQIRKYLNGDRIQLLHLDAKSDLSKKFTSSEIMSGGTVVQHKYMDNLKTNLGLVYEERKMIDDWIKGNG